MNETTQSPSTVNMVVGYLGLLGLVGLVGVIWLVHDKTDPAAIAIVVGLVGPPIGALAGILATTKTSTVIAAQHEAAGYKAAVTDLHAMDPNPSTPGATWTTTTTTMPDTRPAAAVDPIAVTIDPTTPPVPVTVVPPGVLGDDGPGI